VEWIKQHPYLAGFGILAAVILFFVLRRSGGSGGTQVIQSGATGSGDQAAAMQLAANAQTEHDSAALQALAIQAQTQLQISQVVAGTQTNQTAAQLQAAQAGFSSQTEIANTAALAQMQSDAANYGAQTSIAQTQAGAQITLAQTQADQSTTIAGIQAQVANTQLTDALAAHKLDDVTSVQINSQNTQRDIQLAQDSLTQAVTLGAYKATTDAAQIQADLSISQDNNLTAITINNQNANRDKDIAKITADNAIQLAGISAGVQQAQLTATEDVWNHFLDTQSTEQLAAISAHAQEVGYQTSVEQSIVNLVSSGQINKGGEGGRNQVAVIAALTGQSAIGAQAEVQQQPWYTSFFNAIANVGAAAAKGAAIP
jgi:hypothetical protein